jgi:AAA family ATP:ADP antiporter
MNGTAPTCSWRYLLLRTSLAAVAFFFLMTSYYVIKPTRVPTLLSQIDKIHLPDFYAITTVITLAGVFLYNYLVGLFRRTTLLRIVFGFTIALFIIFWQQLHQSLHGNVAKNLASQVVVASYFLLTSTYIVFFTALFWSFNHDLHNYSEAEKFYPYIAFGAQIGVITGSYITGQYVKKIGSENLLLVSAVGLTGCWLCLEGLKLFDPHPPGDEYAKPQETGAIRDIEMFFSSRYVLFIGLLVLFATFTPTLCDFQFNWLLTSAVPDKSAQTACWANINFYMGLCNIAMCLLITPALIRLFGPAVTICLYPLVLLVGAVFFLHGVGVDLASYFVVAALSLNYTLYTVGKEVFYVPTDKTTKYKLKAMCDTFLFRFGDLLASGVTALYLYVAAIIEGVGKDKASVIGINYVILLTIVIWIPVILYMGKQYKERTASTE